jgi:hypothetical protein
MPARKRDIGLFAWYQKQPITMRAAMLGAVVVLIAAVLPILVSQVLPERPIPVVILSPTIPNIPSVKPDYTPTPAITPLPFTVWLDEPAYYSISLCRRSLRDVGDFSAGLDAFVALPYCVHFVGSEGCICSDDARTMTFSLGPIAHTGWQGEIHAIRLVLDSFKKPEPVASVSFVTAECGGFGKPDKIEVSLNEVSIDSSQREVSVLDTSYPLALNEVVTFLAPVKFIDPGTYTFHFEILARESAGARFQLITGKQKFTWKEADIQLQAIKVDHGSLELCSK